MTAQLSRERLEEIAALEIKITDDGTRYSPKAHGKVYSHEMVTMARMLLAGMNSEPVAYIIQDRYERQNDEPGHLSRSHVTKYVSDDDIQEHEITCTTLYAAPPAPVASTAPDGLRMALSNAGIAAPESDEVLFATHEKYVQLLVDWVKDHKPFAPAPVAVPDKWPDCSSAGFGTYDGCIPVVTPSGKISDIDACLVSEVVGLWQQGITTIESCCGHGKASSYIAVIPDDNVKMLLLGYTPSTESGAPHVFYSKTSKHDVNDGPAMQVEPVSQRYTLPPHIYRELVNQLRDTAVKYQGCQQLREQISATLRTVITPAAPEQECAHQYVYGYHSNGKASGYYCRFCGKLQEV